MSDKIFKASYLPASLVGVELVKLVVLVHRATEGGGVAEAVVPVTDRSDVVFEDIYPYNQHRHEVTKYKSESPHRRSCIQTSSPCRRRRG